MKLKSNLTPSQERHFIDLSESIKKLGAEAATNSNCVIVAHYAILAIAVYGESESDMWSHWWGVYESSRQRELDAQSAQLAQLSVA